MDGQQWPNWSNDENQPDRSKVPSDLMDLMVIANLSLLITRRMVLREWSTSTTGHSMLEFANDRGPEVQSDEETETPARQLPSPKNRRRQRHEGAVWSGREDSYVPPEHPDHSGKNKPIQVVSPMQSVVDPVQSIVDPVQSMVDPVQSAVSPLQSTVSRVQSVAPVVTNQRQQQGDETGMRSRSSVRSRRSQGQVYCDCRESPYVPMIPALPSYALPADVANARRLKKKRLEKLQRERNQGRARISEVDDSSNPTMSRIPDVVPPPTREKRPEVDDCSPGLSCAGGRLSRWLSSLIQTREAPRRRPPSRHRPS